MLIAIKLSEDNKVPRNIQLLRVGEFLSEEYGKLQITKDILLSLKNNFDNKVRGYEDGKLPIDYFHENTKFAAGWIESVSLDNGDTELWANVVWTPGAEQKLSDKELRYVSAEFHFDYKDNEKDLKYGPTLFGAGLTNRPFIKGMAPVVQFNEKQTGEKKMDLAQAMEKIKELEAELAKAKGAQPAELAAVQKELGDVKKELSETQAKYAEEKALAEKTSKFNTMLTEGKVVEAQRESFLSNDVIKFSELSKPTNLAGKGTDEGGTGGTQTAAEKVLALAEKEKKDVRVILAENVELRKQYEKEMAV